MMPTKAPSDAGRNVVRVQITLMPAELAEVDALAARLARPGYPSNRSDTIRTALRYFLNAEADGRVAAGGRSE